MKNSTHLICIQKCRVQDTAKTLLADLSWTMKTKEAWLVIGRNGSGKADFLKALSGQMQLIPNTPETVTGKAADIPLYSNNFSNSVEIVSLEKAASLIEEERNNDESEYLDGGVDAGRTGRIFLSEAVLGHPVKKHEPLPECAKRLESDPQVKLCGIEKILDRGLKYMSTGEIRRTLLCHALLSGKKLLILSDPFAGLDAQSRSILLSFFNEIVKKQLSDTTDESSFPRIILSMERYFEIPEDITHVLEFNCGKISFCGLKKDYEKKLVKLEGETKSRRAEDKAAFTAEVSSLNSQAFEIKNDENSLEQAIIEKEKIPLIEMKNVRVAWDGHVVLDNVNWTLNKGEHYLIRGPNGSGKTTLLELITGDNMQVYCNNVSLFGKRRGTGETVWEIKARLGIVSYRMHVEYRMLGGTDLESVIISGFHDSIGLYEQKSDVEIVAAKKWLALGGFAGREHDSFGSLSYGEQRAVLILRAAVKCPAILILDEPCHGLDDEYRQKILDLLETIAESGTTTLLHVTHDPSEVLPCEKHILELHPGEKPMYKIITSGK